ncbi:hypothetical protein GOP47_0021518 [Adiantum capillus-veneris]|uniref:AMP-dependent synthetase/ligase domain-containing protein n=1 Tax=Adiantum capillus-veneris TaxID=13818 RepID=A0A9D4U9S5_ADICA|nr:hypothetical protein GOP47_0021518 [Adiantum capillus-veneris]
MSKVKGQKDLKVRGVTVEVGGEPGLTKRSHRFLKLVETPWEGAVTLAALYEQSCQKNSTLPAFGTRMLLKKEAEVSEDGRTFDKLTLGEYEWITFHEGLEQASNFASGLMAIGHGGGEHCAIFAETRADWFIALQGCFRQSLTVVTVYASLGEEALVHSLNETEVTTVICDHKQMRKLIDISSQLNTVRRVILLEDHEDKSQLVIPETITWRAASFTEVKDLGKSNPVDARMPAPADVAVIMYTSGSTGLPKGVIITHGNMVATVAGVMCLIPELSSSDRYLAYLPLAHVLELAAECTLSAAGAAIGYGSPLTLTDTSNKVKKGTKGDAAELKPTLLTAVPAILDRVRDGVRKMVEKKGGSTKTLFDLAYKRCLNGFQGTGAGTLEKRFWSTLVFKKVRAILGGSVRGMLSGGAPLSADTQRFINICFGAPIGQAYGLTETCAGATFSEWDDLSVGRVGPPIPHCYIKLIDWNEGGYRITDEPMPRGEIVIGGPSVTPGYFKNQAKTDEVYKVDETGMRWFYTGDIGQFHPDGCLEIIDRKKDIVKLQHGEYVSLGKVEAALIASPYVDSIMLHVDPAQSHCVALIVASQAAVENWARKEGIEFEDFPSLCEKEQTAKEIIKSLQKVGKSAKLERFEIPAKVKLLSEPWTPEKGFMTAAMKLKRENLRKAFADDLKKLYS